MLYSANLIFLAVDRRSPPLMIGIYQTKTPLLAIVASLSATGSLAQSTDYTTTASHTGGGIGGLISVLIGLLIIIGMWKVFAKAGQPGWASIIPIYNAYIMCKIAGKPGWWVILLFVPFVNLIIAILIMVALAQSFGKALVLRWGCCYWDLFLSRSWGLVMRRIKVRRQSEKLAI